MQIDIQNPHDTMFKNVFDDIDNTKDFLKAYLPDDLVKEINFSTMKKSDTEKSDLKYQKFYLDLSVECQIGEKKSQVYIIFEHKSYRDKMTLIQILNYCLVVWENELLNGKKSLTPIIPFIFYHNDKESGLHENFRDYFDIEDDLKKYLLDFKMIIFDTTKVENSEIQKKINNLFLSASILLMKNIFKDTSDLKPVLKNIIELDDDRQIMLFEYIVTKKDMTEEKFNEIIIEMKGDSEMASLAEMWTNRVRLEEAQANIKMGLELKFNQISDKLFLLIQKIKEIDKLKEIQKALFVMNDADEFKKFVKKTI